MDNTPNPDHLKLAAELVAETHANDGLAPVDLEQFYADQKIARQAPFREDIPQCPLGLTRMSGECVFSELGIAEDHWRYQNDEDWRLELNRAYNDKAEAIVNRRLLQETKREPTPGFPPRKALRDIFEAENVWHDRSWWLQQAADNEEELTALLDRVEERLENLRSFLLPPSWDEVKDDLLAQGIKPGAYRGQRGPITFAASVYGPENLIFLIHDNPDLAGRFRDAIKNAMLGIAKLLDDEAGYTKADRPCGFNFADDNCCLMTPDMYEFFGEPIIAAVFDYCAPGPDDRRYQHSDSDMAHIIPILARQGLNGCNFGPNVRADYIRAQMPDCIINGQLAPFTFSRNEEVNIVAEFLRDFEMTRESRGLVFTTAGSINNGSRLTGLRLIMAAIQRYGRY